MSQDGHAHANVGHSVGALVSQRGTHISGLDGIRAAAVLAVVAYHADIWFLKGGYLGVDVFFVLSGFLITSILLRELSDTTTIRLLTFYARRALRLFPALAAVCAVVLILWWFVPDAPNRSATLGGVPAALTYLSSWVRALDISTLGAMGHTWSLAVEEHFYLIWPLIILAAVRVGGRVRLVIAIVASLGICYRIAAPIAFDWGLERIYNGSDTQAAQLLIGCALAAWLHRSDRVIGRLPALLGVFIVGFGFFGLERTSSAYLAGASLVVGLGAAVAIGHIATTPSSFLTTALAWGPASWIGKRSYGIYLWHHPIFGFLAPLDLPPVLKIVLSAGLTVLVPALSYRYLEQPILALKDRLAPRASVASSP